MLTPTDVLNYIKTNLGIPYTPVEYDDEQLLTYVRQVPLRTFSKLCPDTNKMLLNLQDPNIQTDIPNEFRIVDPDGLQIIDIISLVPEQSGLIISGHPIIGLFGGNMHDVEDYMLKVEQSTSVYKYSMFNERFEFLPPNIIRILPKPSLKPRLVEYERNHSHDFRTIRPEFEDTFLRLAYCDTAIWIARTRSAFRTLNTPFGDIELNVEDLKSEAQTEKDKILEELSMYNPSIIVDSG